jgi:rubrerythrin
MTSTFNQTGRPTELAGSPWDESLLRHFSEHVEGERELLEAYVEFRESGPEHVRYLVDLILDDEAHHHRTFRELVNRLKSDIDWKDYGPQVPYLDKKSADRATLLEATERFLTFEREDAKSLAALQKELRPVRDTTLFSLLVELMQLDTKKHITILEFIRRHAKTNWER